MFSQRGDLRYRTRWTLSFIRDNPWLLIPNRKTVNYLKYAMSKKEAHIDRSVYRPLSVFLSLSRRCNLSCEFCCVGSELNNSKWRREEATVESVERLFRQDVFRNALFVNLVGGEPTLNKDLAEIVRWLKSKRYIVGLTTNGFRLKKSIAALSDARLDFINLSLYQENQDVVEDALKDITGRFKTKISRVITANTVTDEKTIRKTLEIARHGGCRTVVFLNTIPTYNAFTDLSKLVIREEHFRMFNDLSANLEREFPEIAIQWPQIIRGAEVRKRTCRMPWYSIFTDVLGSAGYCCHTNRRMEDNIFDHPEEGIANGSLWREVRDGLSRAERPLADMCKDCYLAGDNAGGVL